jgi:hypothetical protein
MATMMTKEHFEKAMLGLLLRKPFQPFIIAFDDGDQFVVGQPEALMYRGGDSAMFFGPRGDMNLFHSEAVHQLIELAPVKSA